jgi:hypothetical protein
MHAWRKNLPASSVANILAMGLQLRPIASAMDLPLEDAWAALAQRLWLSGNSAQKVKPETIKTDIWDALEADRFSLRALTTLENLQILEKYGSTRSAENSTRD